MKNDDLMAILSAVKNDPMACHSIAVWDKIDSVFPQPQRKPDAAPCGECHIQPGETCDICGAKAAP